MDSVSLNTSIWGVHEHSEMDTFKLIQQLLQTVGVELKY